MQHGMNACQHKPKLHLARHVTSRHDTTDATSQVEFGLAYIADCSLVFANQSGVSTCTADWRADVGRHIQPRNSRSLDRGAPNAVPKPPTLDRPHQQKKSLIASRHERRRTAASQQRGNRVGRNVTPSTCDLYTRRSAVQVKPALLCGTAKHSNRQRKRHP